MTDDDTNEYEVPERVGWMRDRKTLCDINSIEAAFLAFPKGRRMSMRAAREAGLLDYFAPKAEAEPEPDDEPEPKPNVGPKRGARPADKQGPKAADK